MKICYGNGEKGKRERDRFEGGAKNNGKTVKEVGGEREAGKKAMGVG